MASLRNYDRRALLSFGSSILISLLFAVYNGVVGFTSDSIWSASVFVFYGLVTLIKTMLLAGDIFVDKEKTNTRYVFVFVSFAILTLMIIAMVAPEVILITNKRTYESGLVFAIATAAYVTYKITITVVNMNRGKTKANILIKQIRLADFVDAIMSVLVLQNTLIVTNGGYEVDMKYMSLGISIALTLLCIVLIVWRFVTTIRNRRLSMET